MPNTRYRGWDELGFDFPCPTERELENHLKDGNGWNETQDIGDFVVGIVTRDGWACIMMP